MSKTVWPVDSVLNLPKCVTFLAWYDAFLLALIILYSFYICKFLIAEMLLVFRLLIQNQFFHQSVLDLIRWRRS